MQLIEFGRWATHHKYDSFGTHISYQHISTIRRLKSRKYMKILGETKAQSAHRLDKWSSEYQQKLVRMAMGQSRQSLWHRSNLQSFPCHFHVISMSFPCHFHVISMSFPCHFHIFPSVWRGDVWPIAIAIAEHFSSSRHNRPPTAPPEESPGILRLSGQQDHLNSTNVINSCYELLSTTAKNHCIASYSMF